jgi:hypothetical protein
MSMNKFYNPPMTEKEKLICKKINRISKQQGSQERVCKARSLAMFQNVGRFYILDVPRNMIKYYNADLERLLQEVDNE